MAWKIEKILGHVSGSEDLDKIEYEYDKLGLRETVIIICAQLDVLLAELISKRLRGEENEIIDFIGADEDGRAPAGSFGSRIQLGHLLGFLSQNDLTLLRKCKQLRNDMAHRIVMNHLNAKTQGQLEQVKEGLLVKLKETFGFGSPEKIVDTAILMAHEKAGNATAAVEGMKNVVAIKAIFQLLIIFYTVHFSVLNKKMQKIPEVHVKREDIYHPDPKERLPR